MGKKTIDVIFLKNGGGLGSLAGQERVLRSVNKSLDMGHGATRSMRGGYFSELSLFLLVIHYL